MVKLALSSRLLGYGANVKIIRLREKPLEYLETHKSFDSYLNGASVASKVWSKVSLKREKTHTIITGHFLSDIQNLSWSK